jgi:hypothetical protein
MISDRTKSPKSPRGEFLHVFSSEFLTKEEIEINEKAVKKQKAVPQVMTDDLNEDPKVISI